MVVVGGKLTGWLGDKRPHMSKDFYFKAIVYSSVPLFLLLSLFIQTHVSKFILLIIFAVLQTIRLSVAGKKKQSDFRSITKKGLLQAAIAAPFLLIVAVAALLGIEFGIEYLRKFFEKDTIIAALMVLLFSAWAYEICVLVKKDRQKT